MPCVCISLSVYQHTGNYCKINARLGCAREGEGCEVNEDALPLTGTSIPAVTSAHTAAAAYSIAVYQQPAPAGGIRQRRSVFPQQHKLLPLASS